MANNFRFDIQPTSRFQGASAAIRRPKVSPPKNQKTQTNTPPQELTSFSFDSTHNYHWDDSSLRYYYPPTLPADLNQGYEEFKRLDDSADEHLDALLDTLAGWEEREEREGRKGRVETDVVTWRGMMTKVRFFFLDWDWGVLGGG